MMIKRGSYATMPQVNLRTAALTYIPRNKEGESTHAA
jgi:hypothetical protein